jgi:hypothetical protein
MYANGQNIKSEREKMKMNEWEGLIERERERERGRVRKSERERDIEWKRER